MPTWPTTTVSTSNLNAGSDSSKLARADIKQMADVVNELVNYGAPASTFDFFIVGSSLNDGSGALDKAISGTVDTNSFYNITWQNSGVGPRWKFNTTGTFLCFFIGSGDREGINVNFSLRNMTSNSDIVDFGRMTGLGQGWQWRAIPFPLVVSSTNTEYAFYYDSGNGSSGNFIAYTNGITMIGFKV